jgi:hypothetical protein
MGRRETAAAGVVSETHSNSRQFATEFNFSNVSEIVVSG